MIFDRDIFHLLCLYHSQRHDNPLFLIFVFPSFQFSMTRLCCNNHYT
jgi:hypothetical protein